MGLIMKTIQTKTFAFLVLITLCTTMQPVFGMSYNQEILNRNLITCIGSNGTLHEIQDLVNKGASVDAQDEYDYPALVYTIWHNSFDVLKYLILRGANPDLSDSSEQNTPLHYAVRYDKFKCVKYLIERGAKTDLTNNNHQTAYDLALEDQATDMISYFGLVNTYQNYGILEQETLENQSIIPDYVALSIIHDQIWDIKTIARMYNDRTPCFQYYIHLAERLKKKHLLHELTFVKMNMIPTKP